MSYTRGGVSASGGIAAESRHGTPAKAAGGIPYLKIMAGIILLILLGVAWLVLSAH
jgi:hypothetical protein